jgi:hypothetical protein
MQGSPQPDGPLQEMEKKLARNMCTYGTLFWFASCFAEDEGDIFLRNVRLLPIYMADFKAQST